MTIQDLNQFKNIHGRLKFINKLGCECTLYGYIREVNQDHALFQDNEYPDKFKIRNVISFMPFTIPTLKQCL